MSPVSRLGRGGEATVVVAMHLSSHASNNKIPTLSVVSARHATPCRAIVFLICLIEV